MLYTYMDKSDRGLDVFLEWLNRRDGTDWSKHPTREDAMREYSRIWTLLGSRQIEEPRGVATDNGPRSPRYFVCFFRGCHDRILLR